MNLSLKRYTIAFGFVAFAQAGGALAAEDVVTDHSGMTLYTFDLDETASGKSACDGGCAAMWPPASASNVAGIDFASIVRVDGMRQATYKGKPVYQFVRDQRPGDRFGDGVDNVWHAIPLGEQASKQAPVRSAPSGGYGGYSYGY